MRKTFLYLASAFILLLSVSYTCLAETDINITSVVEEEPTEDDLKQVESEKKEEVVKVEKTESAAKSAPEAASSGIDIKFPNYKYLITSKKVYIYKMTCKTSGEDDLVFYIYSNSEDLYARKINDVDAGTLIYFTGIDYYENEEEEDISKKYQSQFPILDTRLDRSLRNILAVGEWKGNSTYTNVPGLLEWGGTNYDVYGLAHYNWSATYPTGNPSMFVGYVRRFTVTESGSNYLAGTYTFDSIDFELLDTVGEMKESKIYIYAVGAMLFIHIMANFKKEES